MPRSHQLTEDELRTIVRRTLASSQARPAASALAYMRPHAEMATPTARLPAQLLMAGWPRQAGIVVTQRSSGGGSPLTRALGLKTYAARLTQSPSARRLTVTMLDLDGTGTVCA